MFVNRISRIRRRVDFGLYEEIETDILPLVTIKCGTSMTNFIVLLVPQSGTKT